MNQFWLELSLNCTFLNSISLRGYLNTFWKNVMNKMESHQVVYVLLKVKFDDNSFAAYSKLQSVNNSMFEDLLDTLISFLDSKAENYSNKVITNVIFQYHICSPLNKDIRTNLSKSDKVRKVPSFRFAGKNLPQTTNLSDWGVVNELSDNKFEITNKLRTYEVTRFEDKQIVDIMSDDNILFSFTDIFGNNPTSFTRYLKNQEFIFKDGSLLIKKLNRKTDFITKIKTAEKISNKFITFDIETKNIDNVKVPYCVSIYDGSKFKSFYLTDYVDSEVMLRKAISYLLKRSYNGYKVYIHNLSHFDGIFLFRILSNYLDCTFTPVLKDGKMISLKFSWKPTGDSLNVYSIEFKDSYLMLPISLRKLAKAFNVEDKGLFPYSFANEIDLNYIGQVPEFKYFDKISVDEYNNYKASFTSNWNLRNETIKYCELDCISLHQVLIKFNELIFNNYQLNIHKFPTLPSLAFGIFRSNYLVENTIPKIGGQMYFDIRKGYTGNHTDVYKPFGNKVYRYDANSLYPFVMGKFPMPIGKITFFEGNILETMNKPFGFFECEVTAPKNMDRPLLQTKVQTKEGLRTVAPLGQWTDMVFSEEMKEYMKYGYKFKVLRGYLFDQGLIFEDYVNDLYKIKEGESKDSPIYLIYKLLMNSLYGRFGMNPYLIEHNLIDNSVLDDIISKKGLEILDCLNLNNDKSIISYQYLDDIISIERYTNVNISIAAAVTAYARIYMSKFIGNRNLNVLYTDKDSIDIDRPLDPKLIGNDLGLMKLEHIFNEVIYLSPKVYGGLTDNYEYVNVKGLKNPITFQDMKSLLYKDSSLVVNQENWNSNISEDNIQIKQEIYTLINNNQKRELIYDKNNKVIGTNPIILDNNKQ